MMKKVLALVMVLSMAGFASAALQIDVAGGKATVMGQLEADQYLILTAGNGASLSNFALGAAAPSMSSFFMSAADFEGLGVGYVAPAGFAGEAWVMASAPGEAYKNGAQLMADLALKTSQSTRTWEEIVDCTQVPNGKLTRTWTEVTDVIEGALSLSVFSEITGQTARVADKMADSRTVSSLTFVDGPCVPEPLTLSLLGLGALVLRRRS
jgi:hypothetical protein